MTMALKCMLNLSICASIQQHTSFRQFVLSEQRKIKKKKLFAFAKLANRWMIYLSTHGWDAHIDALCVLSKTSIYFFSLSFSLFELLLMPDSGEKSTAPIRGTGPEQLAGGGGMDNNAAVLSPGAPASQFWLPIHLASVLHRLLSAQPSPRRCAVVQYRAAPEGVELPARAKKWKDSFHIINSSHGLRSISSHTLSVFDTLGRFYLCTPTHAKPNTIYSEKH